MRHLNKVLQKYVGIPYESGGESFDGSDCYGLIKIFYKDFFDIELNLKRSKENPVSENSQQISELFFEPKKKDQFIFGDILTFLTPLKRKSVFHAGIAVNPDYLLHSDYYHGSSIQLLKRYLFVDTLRNVFRLKSEIKAGCEKRKLIK